MLRSPGPEGAACRLASVLARNNPTLLAKNYQHHTELVTRLPVGKSASLPRGKSRASQGLGASARGYLGRPGRFLPETEHLRHAFHRRTFKTGQ